MRLCPAGHAQRGPSTVSLQKYAQPAFSNSQVGVKTKLQIDICKSFFKLWDIHLIESTKQIVFNPERSNLHSIYSNAYSLIEVP